MKIYSTQEQIADFKRGIGERPLFVCDMDGNVLTGYSIINPEKPIPLGIKDDPQKQAIPFGTTQDQLRTLVNQRILKEGIFAQKAMDARLPQNLVDFVNQSIQNDLPFRIAFLTSRSASDAQKILQESGVQNVLSVTLVADSGASLYIRGKQTEVRKLSDEEATYLHDLDNHVLEIQTGVEQIVKKHFSNAEGKIPLLFVEHKGIATNIHYREILILLNQPDNSVLDKDIGAYIKSCLQKLVEAGPKDESSIPVFKTLDAPAAVEMKIASVNKGHGLAAIIEASLGGVESELRPTAVVFSGDDVAKGNGTPGTDWYAMDRARALSAMHGVPVLNIHTHHPVANDLLSHEPDMNKDPSTLSVAFPKPPISLVVRSPEEMAKIILTIYTDMDNTNLTKLDHSPKV